jgi:hypothetical protein
VEPNSFPFVPFSMESYGRLGQPPIKLLHELGDEAAGPGRVDWASLVAGALRKLKAGWCRGKNLMYHACFGMLAKSSGRGFWAGVTELS